MALVIYPRSSPFIRGYSFWLVFQTPDRRYDDLERQGREESPNS
jgi:hypothetical protein